MTSVLPWWTSIFLDVPANRHDRAAEFWTAATGTTLSEPRGTRQEFRTLVAAQGDDHLRMQRVADGEPRVHLDFHVDDPRTAAERAATLGATELADRGYVVMRSPGGFTFCFVTHPARHPAPPNRWPDGQLSQLDQVALDIPSADHASEIEFWATLTGWRVDPQQTPEFVRLDAPAGQPVQILLQRRLAGNGPVRAHLDFATSAGGRDAEVARHVVLGATPVRRHAGWTVLTDPVGLTYCVTDHRPRTG